MTKYILTALLATGCSTSTGVSKTSGCSAKVEFNCNCKANKKKALSTAIDDTLNK